MAQIITEDMIEQAAIRMLMEENRYNNSVNCFTKNSDTLPDTSGRENKKQVVLPKVLLDKLCELNPHIPKETIKDVAQKLCNTPKSVDTMDANYKNYKLIKNGVPVTYQEDGKEIEGVVKIIDFGNPSNNDFTVCSQLWIKGETYWRRPDLIIFINGLPMVFIELKNSNIGIKNAYDKNLTDYKKDIPFLFHYNQITILSNATETRVGSYSAGYEYFFEWLRENENDKPNREDIKENKLSLVYLIKSLLTKENLIDYIENFVLFDRKKTKLIAKNHQFLGVNNAYNAFLNREILNGKLGVFWHTQGSGKSYSMVMFASKIRRKCEGNYTFLIVTDRKDLDDQIYKNFLRTEFITKEEKVRPKSGAKLRSKLKTNATVLFTLIHKFIYDKTKKYPELSERDDIIVIVDEAHRTQYKDLAENMRIGLPNAQYIAFTGTPLLGSKRLTNAWFGDYVSEYNFAQSIEDSATVPLYYTKRVPEVELINEFLDSDFADILESDNLNDEEQKRLETYYAKEMEVIKRDGRIDTIAKDIVYHFPRRGYLGKGMVISIDKFTAVRMYDKVTHYWREEIKNLNLQIKRTSDELEKTRLKGIVEYMRQVEMAVIVSEEDGEEEKFNKNELSIKIHRDKMNAVDENGFDIEDYFKNPNHPLQLVFVCSMWLTGFDAPSVSTLYLDKPMKNHTLMQAIARANRVFPNKNNGIIVDYLDVFKHLKRALAEYAISDEQDNMPVKNIEELLDGLKKTIDLTGDYCKDIDIDLSSVLSEYETFDKLDKLDEFANVILSNDEWKNEFKVYANVIEMIYEALKPEIFNMEFDGELKDVILYLRGIILGRIRPDKLEDAKKRINELLDQSVMVAEEKEEYSITNTAKEIDLSAINFEELRGKLKTSKYKNIEITNLRKFIEEKLEKMLKKNVTRGNFADIYQNIIDNYNAGGSKNDDFYERLIKFMEDLRKEEERHIREELTEEELEIYDLLRKDKLSQKEERQVKLAAKGLYETLTSKKDNLFVVGWQNDSQPKEKIKNEIINVLDATLPTSYEKPIFNEKTKIIYEHILDQAITGANWVA